MNMSMCGERERELEMFKQREDFHLPYGPTFGRYL